MGHGNNGREVVCIGIPAINRRLDIHSDRAEDNRCGDMCGHLDIAVVVRICYCRRLGRVLLKEVMDNGKVYMP